MVKHLCWLKTTTFDFTYRKKRDYPNKDKNFSIYLFSLFILFELILLCVRYIFAKTMGNASGSRILKL
jgi:hypothetical protein